ncbi:hypothetical protein [Streptobacillus moniliformis]|uniref:hypothetical protein n=1 Tax=Streptobacillus moniliformis TaxID=34105 RepID=UPI0007E2E012|nr:hypothetical protein [Streptobacillus moniliformis]
MKKFLIFLHLLIFTISCTSRSEKVVGNFMKDFKEFNIEKTKEYVSNPELIDSLNISFKNESQVVFFNALLENLQYEVQNRTKREDGSEVVNVKISNIDVKKTFELAYKQIFKKTFLGENDVKAKDVFIELMTSKNIPKLIIISQFLMISEGRDRKILLRKENINDILGKYFTTLNGINLNEQQGE